MIQDVDQTLSQLLTAELGRVPGCPVHSAEQITFDPPVEAAANLDGEARVNLYLYDVRENLKLRNESFPQSRDAAGTTVGKKRAPVRINLSYLVTAHAGRDPATEHRLLGDVLAVLLRHLAVPREYLAGTLTGLGSNMVPMAIAQPEHRDMMEASGLWQPRESLLPPGLPLVVTAPFDPFETKWTRVVRELVSTLGQGGSPDAPNRQAGISSLRASAAGVVVDQRTERPLAGVAVRAEGREETVQTDTRGFFLLLNLPPGPQTLRFENRGYRVLEVTAAVPPPGRLEQMEPLVVALPPLTETERAEETAARETAARNLPGLAERERVYQASFTGTLRYADGQPAALLPVFAGARQTVTDADGVYCFFDLPPGEQIIRAVLPGQGDVEVLRHVVPATRIASV